MRHTELGCLRGVKVHARIFIAIPEQWFVLQSEVLDGQTLVLVGTQRLRKVLCVGLVGLVRVE